MDTSISSVFCFFIPSSEAAKGSEDVGTLKTFEPLLVLVHVVFLVVHSEMSTVEPVIFLPGVVVVFATIYWIMGISKYISG